MILWPGLNVCRTSWSGRRTRVATPGSKGSGSGGLPVRATLNISFKQYRPLSEQLDDPRRNSSDKTKRRVLTSDDSLWALAHREYGDVRYWRKIARHNRIDNPRLVEAGTALELPPLEQFEQADDDDAART